MGRIIQGTTKEVKPFLIMVIPPLCDTSEDMSYDPASAQDRDSDCSAR
jgi:hypothetical protein